MERGDRPSVATFYAPGAWATRVRLDEAAAHHAQVKRLGVGDVVKLTSGDGRRATAVIESSDRKALVVAIDSSSISTQGPYPQVALYTPVADRDRMLMLAEKAVELGASSWCAVMYDRSRSVTPRGEGDAFRQKLRTRQVNALEQSGGAWLPEMLPDITMDSLAAQCSDTAAARLLLDVEGERLSDVVRTLTAPISIALGPEGGVTEGERARLIQAGWRPVSLSTNVLRFETAGIAALSIVRSFLG